jgi:hypothetical protein
MDTPIIDRKYKSMLNSVRKNSERTPRSSTNMNSMKSFTKSQTMDDFPALLSLLRNQESTNVNLQTELSDPGNRVLESEISKVIRMYEECKMLDVDFNKLRRYIFLI